MATTFTTDFFGNTRVAWGIGGHEYDGAAPSPATYTYDPSDQTTGNDPIVDDSDWYSRRVISNATTNDVFSSSSIVETTTPVGTKAWRCLEAAADKANYLLFFNDIADTNTDYDILILWRRNHGSYAQIGCAARIDDATDDTHCYHSGIYKDDATGTGETRKYVSSVQSTLSNESHGIADTVDEWIFTRFNVSGNTLKVKHWESGEDQPDTWTDETTDSSISTGGAGLFVWLNGVDAVTDPYVDIAWASFGTGGADAPEPDIYTVKHACFAVCPMGSVNLKTGSGSVLISISGGIASLSHAQTGPIGCGCRISYDDTSFCFIKRVISASVFEVVTNTGETPANVSNQTVYSITYEYASLADAAAGAKDSGHLNTEDLVSNTTFLKFPCYYDIDDDTEDTAPASLSYIINDTYGVRVFTPLVSANESLYDQRHLGFSDQNHYRLNCSLNGSHCLTLGCTGSGIEIDGLDIKQSSSGTSDECVRLSSGTGWTVKNSIIHAGALVDSQDGIYCDVNGSWHLVVEKCYFGPIGRAAIAVNSWQTSGTKTLTLDINSCAGYDIGNFGASSYRGFVNVNNNYSGTTVNVNAFNSMALYCGGACFNQYNTSGAINWNIEYCIDTDGTISLRDPSAVGCLTNRTATDNKSPGAGNWVILKDITSAIKDLRLEDNPENDAQNMHSSSSGAGLTMDSYDVAGTLRPQQTLYDCGPFEFISIFLIAEDVNAGIFGIDAATLGQKHPLVAQDVNAGTFGIGTSLLGQVHPLAAEDVNAGIFGIDAATGLTTPIDLFAPFRGTQEIRKLYHGNSRIAKIYIGTRQIY